MVETVENVIAKRDGRDWHGKDGSGETVHDLPRIDDTGDIQAW